LPPRRVAPRIRLGPGPSHPGPGHARVRRHRRWLTWTSSIVLASSTDTRPPSTSQNPSSSEADGPWTPSTGTIGSEYLSRWSHRKPGGWPLPPFAQPAIRCYRPLRLRPGRAAAPCRGLHSAWGKVPVPSGRCQTQLVGWIPRSHSRLACPAGSRRSLLGRCHRGVRTARNGEACDAHQLHRALQVSVVGTSDSVLTRAKPALFSPYTSRSEVRKRSRVA